MGEATTAMSYAQHLATDFPALPQPSGRPVVYMATKRLLSPLPRTLPQYPALRRRQQDHLLGQRHRQPRRADAGPQPAGQGPPTPQGPTVANPKSADPRTQHRVHERSSRASMGKLRLAETSSIDPPEEGKRMVRHRPRRLPHTHKFARIGASFRKKQARLRHHPFSRSPANPGITGHAKGAPAHRLGRRTRGEHTPTASGPHAAGALLGRSGQVGEPFEAEGAEALMVLADLPVEQRGGCDAHRCRSMNSTVAGSILIRRTRRPSTSNGNLKNPCLAQGGASRGSCRWPR